MQLTGSEILVECLKEQGVDTVFGYPGGQSLIFMTHFISTVGRSDIF